MHLKYLVQKTDNVRMQDIPNRRSLLVYLSGYHLLPVLYKQKTSLDMVLISTFLGLGGIAIVAAQLSDDYHYQGMCILVHEALNFLE